MKYLKILLAASGLIVGVSASALAADVKLIANPSVNVDTISADELKHIYLQEKSSLPNGTHVEPVLEKGGRVHQAFLRQYLGRSDDDLQTYYRVLVFTGRGSMPKQLGTDAEVVAYVAKTRGAIGYVSAEISTDGVKTLAIEDARNENERKLITRVEPDYPETLKRLSIGGTVRLQVTIAAKGNVEHVQLLGGNPILAESAATAVRLWVYSASHSRTTQEVTLAFDPLH